MTPPTTTQDATPAQTQTFPSAPRSPLPAPGGSGALRPPVRAPVDQVGKRILSHIAHRFTPDAAAIARDIGAREEVVRDRLQAMRASGLLRGVDLRMDPAALGPSYEYLVSGVPSGDTDRAAIERLCHAPGVTRVFGLASSHSVAFTIRGPDAAAAQARGMELARSAGLAQVQAVMVVNTFHDKTGPEWGDVSPVNADAAGPVC